LNVKLTKRAVGRVHGEEIESSDPINTWRVEPLDKDVFIIGFSVGRHGQEYWQIVGRKGDDYRTADEALAVLQREADEKGKGGAT
jgi:hypothetical protein